VVCGFHVFAFVLNDVMDLPIDRTNPDRRHDPLVRGAITRGWALTIALLQPVLTAGITMGLGGSARAQATLVACYGLLGAYNFWGKRCPIPPVTDTMQGLGWGGLAVYAAEVFGGGPNALAWTVAAFATLYTIFMNGIHGGLRDLENDLASGA